MTDSLSPILQQAAATPPNGLTWQRRLLHTVSIAFLVAVVAGVTCLLHAGWHSLPELLRISILIGSSAGTFAFTMWLRKRNRTGLYTLPAAAVALYCYVIDIAGLIQMFNVETSTVPLLLCTAFAFLLAFSLQSRWLLATGLIGTVALVSIWVGADVSTCQLYAQTRKSLNYIDFAPEILLPAACLIFLVSFVPAFKNFRGFAAFLRLFSSLIVIQASLLFTSIVQQHDFNDSFEGGNGYFSSFYGIPAAMLTDVCLLVTLLILAPTIWLGKKLNSPVMLNTAVILFGFILFDVFSNWAHSLTIVLLVICVAATCATLIYLRTMRWKTVFTMALLVIFIFVTKLLCNLLGYFDELTILPGATLLFFLLYIPFQTTEREANRPALLPQRHVIVAGTILMVIANAYVVSAVMWNRSGEPDSTLLLSERELTVPGSETFAHPPVEQAPQAPLALYWRYPAVTHPVEKYMARPRYATWLDDAKLAELGFPARKPMPAKGTLMEVNHPIAKEVFLVLEFEGQAWQKALDGAAAFDEYEATREKTPIEISEEKFAAPHEHVTQLKKEQSIYSRLFVIDAGLDQARLRTKYPDRKHYAIVRGMVTPYEFKYDDSAAGEILGLGLGLNSIEQIADFNQSCHPASKEQIRGYFGYYVEAFPVAPCTATVAFGKRLEPWIMDAAPKQDTHPSGK